MKRAVLGFIAGFIATLVFHQLALELLHLAHLVPNPAWSFKPVPPFGVPSVISLSTLVAWFIVAPLKHQPMAGGWKPRTMLIGPAVNGVWGFFRLSCTPLR